MAEPAGDRADVDDTARTRITGLGADYTLGPGEAEVEGDLPAGQISAATFTLPPARSEFRMFGFLPTHATVKITQVGVFKGTYASDAVDVSGQVDIQITEVGHLGFRLPLANCRSTTPADIDLTARGTFDPDTGGTLSGEYRIPKMSGCGIGTPIINALVTGKDNPLTIKLTGRN